ncbi:MAG: 16S rRNA (uracil(1498)-N(3))-methyltransferase [Cellulosilyticaceae bacterium]
MPKFFVNASDIIENKVCIKGDNFRHIKNVLRLQTNSELLISNRQGQDYKCIISEVESEHIMAEILEVTENSTEPNIEVILFQPLIKGEKLEWVIQKTIEIGVSKIIPIITERCIVKLESDKKIQSKLDRWNKIAEAAAKQSGRGCIPQVCKPISFKEAIELQKKENIYTIIPYENERNQGIKEVLGSAKSHTYGIFIGPEGGFTEDEIQCAINNDVQVVSLGKRILRSETASIVALTNIMYEAGEIG